MTMNDLFKAHRGFIVTAILALCCAQAGAHEYLLGHVKIGHPWARATPPGAQTGGAYLTLKNDGAEDRLLSASSDVSQSVEIHTMSMDGGIMRMEPVDAGVSLPSGKTVEFKPGGLHIMLLGLKAPLKQGNAFALKLRFEKAGEISVDVKVDALGAGAPSEAHH